MAAEVDLKDGIHKMFSGDIINATENRAVLHTALRNKTDKAVLVDGHDVMNDIAETLQKIKSFTNKVVSGKFKGFYR